LPSARNSIAATVLEGDVRSVRSGSTGLVIPMRSSVVGRFSKWCIPKSHRYPTLSAEKRGKDGGTEVHSKSKTVLRGQHPFPESRCRGEKARRVRWPYVHGFMHRYSIQAQVGQAQQFIAQLGWIGGQMGCLLQLAELCPHQVAVPEALQGVIHQPTAPVQKPA